ncbi:MAG TPA: MraY family glycosyltransferase, partial [Phnomibacter sp.]|nr:MraY family glycosyltransferase [Phnomibacter sp.]
AYNLIDGVDGLAAGLAIISSIFFAVYFIVNDQLAFACLATALVGSLMAFLIFNAQPARIFMGDTGSMMLGLLHAMMVIQFISTASAAPVFAVPAAPAIGFALLFVPLFDTLRVFSYRMLKGTSPFTPDRNHIHHILLRFRLSHTMVAGILGSVGLLLPFAAWYLSYLGTNWLLLGMVGAGFLVVGGLVWRYRAISRRSVIQGGVTPIETSLPAVRSITAVGRRAAGQK